MSYFGVGVKDRWIDGRTDGRRDRLTDGRVNRLCGVERAGVSALARGILTLFVLDPLVNSAVHPDGRRPPADDFCVDCAADRRAVRKMDGELGGGRGSSISDRQGRTEREWHSAPAFQACAKALPCSHDVDAHRGVSGCENLCRDIEK